jgi:uncharacterized damage-inducible protein DinB
MSIAALYEGWRKANTRLVEGISGLSDEQLGLRAGPKTWPIWGIAGHTAGSRIYWLCGVLKEEGAETTPMPGAVTGEGWEDHEDQPRTASELVDAFESSWRIVERCLATWTVDMLSDEFTRQIGGNVQIHTRQSVIMRMVTHDAFHAGDISSILGAHGLPEIDLWRPAPAQISRPA